MHINPYESPRPIDPSEKEPAGDSASILQLLTEIRDAQREMLQLSREAMLRQKKSRPYAYSMILVPLAVAAMIFSRVFMRPTPPPPMRPPPATAPVRTPPTPAFAPLPVPKVASLGQQ
jgi:hypothetical protein